MIYIFGTLEEFKETLTSKKIERDIDSVLKLDLPFFDYQNNLLLMHLPTYGSSNTGELLVVHKEDIFMYTQLQINDYERKYKALLKKTGGESTVIIFLILKAVLKNYSEQFQSIRDRMNELDMEPILDSIEEIGRVLRRLTDRMESLVEIGIVLKEREVREFDTKLVAFDYEVLITEARYWLERCRSHMYRIASLRTKSEMQSNKELNDTMKRLTVIITFLTIVSIVVSVPGTIGAIFGIPALSDVYFRPHTQTLVLILVVATIISIIFGLIYWKSLGLKYKK